MLVSEIKTVPQNNLLLLALEGKEVPRVPVWLMRQAGRTLKEYGEVRKEAGSFIKMVKTPELASEVTVQPVTILNVDAAIIFSDILVIPEAMGLPYTMIEEKGPFFPNTVQSEKEVNSLRIAQPEDYQYVTEAIQLTRKKLNNRVPVIGFCGAPWTLFAYMVEGKGSKTFSRAKSLLFSDRKTSQCLLEKITQSCINYLKSQIKAGVHAVQIFDSWAGVLGPKVYQECVIPFLKIMVEEISPLAPVILFCKDAHHSLKNLCHLKPACIGLDWTIDPKTARSIAGKEITLQGNLDPCILYASEETIRSETRQMIQEFGPQRYICNLGHGLYPDIDVEKIRIFIETVKNYKP